MLSIMPSDGNTETGLSHHNVDTLFAVCAANVRNWTHTLQVRPDGFRDKQIGLAGGDREGGLFPNEEARRDWERRINVAGVCEGVFAWWDRYEHALGARLRHARTYLKPPSGQQVPPHCPVPRIREAAILAVLPHLPEDASKRRGGLAIETAIHFSRSRTSGDSGSWKTRSSVFTGRHAVVLPQVNEALGAFLQPLVLAIIAPLLAEAEHHGATLRLDVPHITSAHQLAELMRATS